MRTRIALLLLPLLGAALLLRPAPPAGPSPDTRWNRPSGEPAGTEDQQLLSALGYLAWAGPATEKLGVSLHDPRAEAGLNLVVSGDAPAATLIDMDGATLHRWSLTWEEAFPTGPEGSETRGYWRRARLGPGGDLFALFTGYGVLRLDRDAAPRWTAAGRYHHDLRLGGGLLWTLERTEADGVEDDRLVALDPDTGAVRSTTSLSAALRRSPWHALLAGAAGRDPLHANTVWWVAPGSQPPPLSAGGVLVVLRERDAVLLMRGGEVVWATAGPWDAPHEAQPTPDGGLLLFDNRGAWPRSRALELALDTGAVRWTWDGGELPLSSATCGTVQRLGGGNTLIVSSNQGRAVEVTPSGEEVWAFWNPARSESADGSPLIANLFQVERLPAQELPAALLPARRTPTDRVDQTQ
ncbi:MAG: PQQ-binding-like beta-propeller repeat protein [Deltaproteobacteria bacterium]|nr:PQQ-binding-like beta-propeller repeat protein [Deltaproteobacteria bacterium]